MIILTFDANVMWHSDATVNNDITHDYLYNMTHDIRTMTITEDLLYDYDKDYNYYFMNVITILTLNMTNLTNKYRKSSFALFDNENTH